MTDRFVKFDYAYVWRCPDCGLKNIVEQYFVELAPIDPSPKFVGDQTVTPVSHFEAGPVITTVHCARCESRFQQEPGPLIEGGE